LQKEIVVDVKCSGGVVPYAPVTVDVLAGIDEAAFRRCMEFCKNEGVLLDAFKFVGIGLDRLNVLPKVSESQLSQCIVDSSVVPDAEAELARKLSLELADAAIALSYKVIEIRFVSIILLICCCSLAFDLQNVLLARGLRRSLESEAQSSAIEKKRLLDEIADLKAQLTKKEAERMECVRNNFQLQENVCEATRKLEKAEKAVASAHEDIVKVEREKGLLVEQDSNFLHFANQTWELSRGCFDKFGVKPEDPCWEYGDFVSFFSWLCRQYEDLPTIIQTVADYNCMYCSRALLRFMKEEKDPLLSKIEDLMKVSTKTNEIGRKFYEQYWNSGGREIAFAKAKARVHRV
jgi:hypothetical protein